jgi:hypothetical protein
MMFLIRAALTGSLKGPHLATVAVLLRQEGCLFRIQGSLDSMSG